MLKYLIDELFDDAVTVSNVTKMPALCYVNFETFNMCISDDSRIAKEELETKGYTYLFTVFDGEIVHINYEYI